jgi:uncharacterized protein YdaU (DUF1376 family)
MMARKSPAFSFYPDSWLGGTMRMLPEQRAAYIDLMANQWLEGPFTLETALVVCRGCSEKSVTAVLNAKFVCRGGLYCNDRLEEERQKQVQFAQKQAKNGVKGGRPKGSKKNPNETQMKPKQNPDESQTITQTETQTITQKKLSVSVSDSVLDTSSNSTSTFGEEQQQQFEIVFDSGEVRVGITQGELELWKFTYPHIDVARELQRAWAKMMTTDMRRSNESTIRRYFNNWLSKSKSEDSSGIREVAF